MLLHHGSTSEVKESVIFQQVERIQTSKSSWILSSVLDLEPFNNAFRQIQTFVRSLDRPIAVMERDNEYDEVHHHLIDLTREDVRHSALILRSTYDQFNNICSHIKGKDGCSQSRPKRSVLPLGGLFSFLFGTANQDDLDRMKHQVRTLYENQENQAHVLEEVVSITNISRALINENRALINGMVNDIVKINTTLKEIQHDLVLLMTNRKFLLTHAEILIQTHRLRLAVQDLQSNVKIMEDYLSMFSTGIINPSLISPDILMKELDEIRKQLPTSIRLPESPTNNIWHYYKFLSIRHTTNNEKIIMLIKIPLVENDSRLELFKIYNLPVFNPEIGKSLMYNIESETIAVTLDRKTYAAFPTPA